MSKETLVLVAGLAATAFLLFGSFWILPINMYFVVLSAFATLLFVATLFATARTETEKYQKEKTKDRCSCVTLN